MASNDGEQELLMRLKLMLNHQENEASRRGQRPPLPPAYTIRMAHRFAADDAKQQLSQGATFKNTLSNQIFASKTPYSRLEKIQISQLFLEMPAIGKYVVVRIIENGYQVVGWNSVIEDEDGNVCGFSLYNYDSRELFDVGTVLMIKEPFFKIANQGFQFIRCDCPTDIIVLRPTHPLFYVVSNIQWKNDIKHHVDSLYSVPVPVTASQWKERGNALYKKRQLILAREAYLIGIEKCQKPDKSTLKALQINLTGADLDLGYFENVITTAENIFKNFS
ncbi:hypothetical protein CHUAL_002231 [Chamberlinius hualienensis]